MKQFWCTLRGHPYPKQFEGNAATELYIAWVMGVVLNPPRCTCSHCGTQIVLRTLNS